MDETQVQIVLADDHVVLQVGEASSDNYGEARLSPAKAREIADALMSAADDVPEQ